MIHFSGQFNISPPLRESHLSYLYHFTRMRRIKRDASITASLKDPVRTSVGLPVGIEGEFYAGDSVFYQAGGILDPNLPPKTQPGLWCDWVPNENGTALLWDGDETFYHHEAWLKYLIANFFTPWGYSLTGNVQWVSIPFDSGTLSVVENNILQGA